MNSGQRLQMTITDEDIERDRVDLESKVLAAAFKQSMDLGDSQGAQFAHKQLFQLLRGLQSSRLEMATIHSVPKLNGHDQPSSLSDHAAPFTAPSFITVTNEFERDALLFLEEEQPVESLSDRQETVSEPAKPLTSDASAGAAAALSLAVADPTTPSAAKMPFIKLGKPTSQATTKHGKALGHAFPPGGEAALLIEKIANAKNIYEMVGVAPHASDEAIHRNFIRRVRKLLVPGTSAGYGQSVLEQLRNLWIAHDILIDPRTRGDYDFRVLGSNLNSNAGPTTEATAPPTQPLKIGELFEASGLLDETELQIACDMHKAMPEMQFGRFLVKQGFVQEDQLQAVLIGQHLLRAGKLTMSHFKDAMTLVINRTGAFSAVLLEKGFCSSEDLATLEQIESATARKKPTDGPMGRDVAASSLAKVSIGKAVVGADEFDQLAVDQVDPADIAPRSLEGADLGTASNRDAQQD